MSEVAGAAPDQPMRRVRPWIAALLSLFWPGLGQFYARRTRRAVIWIGLYVVLAAAIFGALHFLEDAAWPPLLPLIVLFQTAAASDAFVVANARRTVSRNSPLRLLGYVAIFAVVIGSGETIRATIPVRSFYIPSASMLPTLAIDDRMLVRMVAPFCPSLAVDRGDVVLIRGRNGLADEMLVRRIVALAGDEVRVDDRGLEVNGARVTGPILRTVQSEVGGRQVSFDVAEERFEQTSAWEVYARSGGGDWNWGPPFEGVVPDGHVFTLGDNRASSNDDRMQGPTPLDAVVGRALRMPFSLASDPGPFWRNLRVHPGPTCASS